MHVKLFLHPLSLKFNAFPTIGRLTHAEDTLLSSKLRLSNLGMLLRLPRLLARILQII